MFNVYKVAQTRGGKEQLFISTENAQTGDVLRDSNGVYDVLEVVATNKSPDDIVGKYYVFNQFGEIS